MLVVPPTPDPVEDAISVYNELIQAPVYTRATVLHSGNSINLTVETSHRNVAALTKSAASQTYTVSDQNIVTRSPLVFTSNDVVHTANGPEFTQKTAVFRCTTRDGKTRRFVEVWSTDGRMLEQIEVGESHGAWYCDDTFGPPSWHPNGHSILYTAELLPPTDASPSSKLTYIPTFGEKFPDSHSPTLFLLTLTDSPFQSSRASPILHQLTTTQAFPDTTFGQALFLPDSLTSPSTPQVLATGYSSLPDGRKLGLVYCANRPAGIYELSLTSSSSKWVAAAATCQSPPELSCRSPRILDEYILVFLSNRLGGPHSSCAQLHAVLLRDGKTTILVPFVDRPATPGGFPGLYVDQLPRSPFVKLKVGGYMVVLTTIWGSRKVAVSVSLKTGEVSRLDVVATPVGDTSSVVVLGTDGQHRVFYLVSCPFIPPALWMRDMNEAGLVLLASNSSTATGNRLPDSLKYKVVPIPGFDLAEAIVISPSDRTGLPLITVPHGGPHSTYTTEFSPQFAALALNNTVALVNYPGSLGFGQAFVDSLPPKLGDLDVEATIACTRHLESLGMGGGRDGARLLMGGSHGGYIAAHLSARYPTFYNAVVLRNPVVDLPSMLSRTDIPDWVYAEAALPYSLDKSPPTTLTSDQFAHLQRLSPIAKVADVVVPTLLLIGDIDKRVPTDQGRAWYHALKGHGKAKVEMRWYAGEGHALDNKVETEVDNFAAGLRFLAKYTK